MSTTRTRFLLILAALLVAALACEGSFSTAKITDAWMSFDSEGTQRTTTFAQDDIFYANVDLKNAPDDTNVKAVWIAVNVEDTDPEFEINSTEYVGSDSAIYFELSNTDALWPYGEYRVDIYLNGEFDRSLSFTVE